MKKKLSVLAMVFVLIFTMFALTGCGDKDKEADADAKETIIVGLDDTFAPMGFRDESGELVGFDIDLARAVAEELGMNVEFKPIDWKAKEAELSAGTVDCLWNGMSVTPDRIEGMALTYKYLNNKIVSHVAGKLGSGRHFCRSAQRSEDRNPGRLCRFRNAPGQRSL